MGDGDRERRAAGACAGGVEASAVPLHGGSCRAGARVVGQEERGKGGGGVIEAAAVAPRKHGEAVAGGGGGKKCTGKRSGVWFYNSN